MPSVSDSMRYFNAFLNSLFKGRQPQDSFNRNPILHGANVNYAIRQGSLTLLLVLLEIGDILWHEKKPNKVRAKVSRGA